MLLPVFSAEIFTFLVLFLSLCPAAGLHIPHVHKHSKKAAVSRHASILGRNRVTAQRRDDLREIQKGDGTKYVFMHHIVGNTYPYVRADWEDDIRQIQAKGVDAIALNVGSSDWQRTQVASAYEAAAAISANLKLFLSFDFTEMPCNMADIVARVNQWSNHPNQFRVNGKVMISTYSGDCFGNNDWASIKAQTNGYLMPFIWGLEGTFNQWQSLDSWYCWGCAWPQGDYTGNTDADSYYISQLGSRYATTISGWMYTHYNYKNFLLNSDNWLPNTRWEQLIGLRDKLTFVEMVTWNDYGESDYFGPVKGAQPSGTTWTQGYPHTAWFDMSEYYITAFKTGVYPTITQDVIYFWARPHPVGAIASSDNLGKPTGWDWVEDMLWAVVFATSSASVTLKSGSNQNTFPVNAGVTKLKLPLSPGSITVIMTTPDGQVVINKTPSDFTFTTSPMTYNYNAYVGSATASAKPIISSSISALLQTTSSSTPATSSSLTSSEIPISSSAATWVYLGCYVDPGNARVLNGVMTSSSSRTVANCQTSCAAKGYSYAGTEYKTECWCGSAIATGAIKAAEGDCSMTCSGKASDVCGGGNRISLYSLSSKSSSSAATSSTTISTPLTSTSSSASSTSSAIPTWQYVGCVAEGTTGSRRALTGSSFTRSNMTPTLCQSLCSGYNYAGVEYGSECYCGNVLTNNGASGDPVDANSCNSVCSGDSSQKCGGAWMLSVYSSGTSSWTSAGCYTDSKLRMLRGSAMTNTSMTTKMCIGICSDGGYSMAATEYGIECYCGNKIFKDGGGGSPTALSECRVSCSGNTTETCGGSWRVNLYTKNL